MKVALIGASGFVGKAILQELLQRGHEVTAIARNAANITTQPNVNIVAADVFNEAELSRALTGNDVVISAYNAGWTNPNLHDDYLAGAKSIQEATKKAGVQRLIVIGGAGSLFIAEGKQLVDSAEFPKDWKPGALAAREYLDIIKQEDTLDWTFFSPAIEMHPGTSGTRKGSYRTSLDTPVFDENGKSILSVEDVAVAITDELEKPRYIRKRFTAAY